MRIVFARHLTLILMVLVPASTGIATGLHAQSSASIVALVNDEPISNHDVDQRVKLALSNSKDIREALKAKLESPGMQKRWEKLVMERRPKSREQAKALQIELVKQLQSEIVAAKRQGMRKQVLEELIDERIQLQQAAKLGVGLSDEDIDDQLDRIAERNKDPATGKPMARAEFVKALEKMGIPISEFRNRLKAKAGWVRVVRRKFQYQVNIGDQDVDRLISAESDANAKLQTLYTIKRLSLPVALDASEAAKAEVFAQAEGLRQTVSTCKQLEDVAGRVSGAEIKSLGTKTADAFPRAMQAYLVQMTDCQLSPPAVTSTGVELYAICDRKQKKVADLSKRDEVKEKLRSEEFEILAKRYMQDLRQEASIEYK